MNCKICNNPANIIFTKKVLHKYDVQYHQCGTCYFIQTDDPFWLDEAYNSAINSSDIGLISRNLVFTEEVTMLFRLSGFDANKKYLDYGAGYGMFVRMMRDNGYNFYWSDDYCDNMYTRKFIANELPVNEQKFEIVTEFEVFEHLPDPIKEIEKILNCSDSILFSTELTKGNNTEEINNWWYIAPEHGQHVAFYNKKTLQYLANKFGLNLYTRKNLHFLTKKKIANWKYVLATTFKIAKIYNTIRLPDSLLESDYKLYLKDQ